MSLNPDSSLQSVPDVSPYRASPSDNDSSMYGPVAGHLGLNLQDFNADATAYQPPCTAVTSSTGAEDIHLDDHSAQNIGGRVVHEANPDSMFGSGLQQHHSAENFVDEDLFSEPVTKGSLFASEELFGDPVHTGNDTEFSQQTLSDNDRQSDSENKQLDLDDEGSADASRPRLDTNASDSSRKTDETLFASTSPPAQELQSTPVPHHIVTELEEYPPKHDTVSRFPLSALAGADPPASVEGGLLDGTTVSEVQEQGTDSQHSNSSTRRTQVMYAPYTVSEGGFIKTDVATPHMVSSRLAQPSSKGNTQIYSDTSYVHQHTALSSVDDDDAQFLEDFIDGPT